jgi:hypothetical protein
MMSENKRTNYLHNGLQNTFCHTLFYIPKCLSSSLVMPVSFNIFIFFFIQLKCQNTKMNHFPNG